MGLLNAHFIKTALLVALFSPALNAHADTWRGTAPFCAGQCNKGEEQIGVSDSGDGGYCVTGHKVLCRNASPTCKATETRSSCYGVVMVCENGWQETLNQVWHTCDTYACGACLGIGSVGTGNLGISSLPGGGGAPGYHSDLCQSGYVWREAVKADHVCVPPASRDRAAQDNAAAAARRLLGGGASGPDTCKSGFVWRKATSNDHACVVPATRAAAADENRQAASHLGPQPNVAVVDTCKRGFVWREAIKDDHVCVLPAMRGQAAQDNAAAAARRLPGGGASGPDTCKPGFVWREAIPSDHVCVTQDVRAATAHDTALASTRVL